MLYCSSTIFPATGEVRGCRGQVQGSNGVQCSTLQREDHSCLSGGEPQRQASNGDTCTCTYTPHVRVCSYKYMYTVKL